MRLRPAHPHERDVGNVAKLDEQTIMLREENQVGDVGCDCPFPSLHCRQAGVHVERRQHSYDATDRVLRGCRATASTLSSDRTAARPTSSKVSCVPARREFAI